MIKLPDLPWNILISELSHSGVAVFYDEFPVTEGHLIFVPIDKKHQDGLKFCFTRAYIEGEKQLAAGKCDGYNIGLNCGKAAGQIIDYPHVHLIFRHEGDVKNPIGGIRGVIPDRQNYKKSDYYK